MSGPLVAPLVSRCGSHGSAGWSALAADLEAAVRASGTGGVQDALRRLASFFRRRVNWLGSCPKEILRTVLLQELTNEL